MMLEDFHVGTVVRLRDIPGPMMRILGLRGEVADCFWFDKHNHPNEYPFQRTLLMKCDPYVPRPREPDEADIRRLERQTAVVETADAAD